MEAEKRTKGVVAVSQEDAARLLEAVRHIREHYPERISISALSKIACMSATKFKYSFRRAYGMTAHEFVRRTRMAEAEKLLAAGDMTVSGVALMVGYMKPGAFAAAFKKHTGMLPRYYMKAHGKIRGRENAAKRAEAAGA